MPIFLDPLAPDRVDGTRSPCVSGAARRSSLRDVATIRTYGAMSDTPPFLGLSVALGCGLLVGLERERRKGLGADREPAGIRTFTIAAASGAIAQAIDAPGLVAIGAIFVAGLTALAHWKSRSRDPGLTTELALFATYLVGIVCVMSPMAGAACGATLAGLLAARTGMHRFATRLLSEPELRDGLLLAALGLVVLPLVPNVAVEWLACRQMGRPA